jgi:hypothetical protein
VARAHRIFEEIVGVLEPTSSGFVRYSVYRYRKTVALQKIKNGRTDGVVAKERHRRFKPFSLSFIHTTNILFHAKLCSESRYKCYFNRGRGVSLPLCLPSLRGKKLATTGNLEGFHLIPRRRFRRRAALRAKLWVTVTRLHVVSVLVAGHVWMEVLVLICSKLTQKLTLWSQTHVLVWCWL